MTRSILLALILLAFSAGAADARGIDHGGGGDVRVAGTCIRGASSTLRVRARDGGIEVRFGLRQTAGRGVWRMTIVHESRISSRAVGKTTRTDDSFELRRMLPDLPGSDTIVVNAWGPNGLGCRAAATLPEST